MAEAVTVRNDLVNGNGKHVPPAEENDVVEGDDEHNAGGVSHEEHTRIWDAGVDLRNMYLQAVAEIKRLSSMAPVTAQANGASAAADTNGNLAAQQQQHQCDLQLQAQNHHFCADGMAK